MDLDLTDYHPHQVSRLALDCDSGLCHIDGHAVAWRIQIVERWPAPDSVGLGLMRLI